MAAQDLPTPEELRKRLRYDPHTGELGWRYFPQAYQGWNKRCAGKPALSTINCHGYRHGSLNGHHLMAHRVVWAVAYGHWPSGDVDHINGDRSDNRLTNLRDVSRSKNLKNSKRYKSNKSGCSGVHWNEKDKRWRATVYVDGSRIWLGSFVTKSEAISARQKAESAAGYHPNHGR